MFRKYSLKKEKDRQEKEAPCSSQEPTIKRESNMSWVPQFGREVSATGRDQSEHQLNSYIFGGIFAKRFHGKRFRKALDKSKHLELLSEFTRKIWIGHDVIRTKTLPFVPITRCPSDTTLQVRRILCDCCKTLFRRSTTSSTWCIVYMLLPIVASLLTSRFLRCHFVKGLSSPSSRYL